LPFSERNPNTGYVPFAARRDAAAAGGRKGRRLPAEVLRTLEGVYGRSPWPSKEVVAGLFDLHRLPRWVLYLSAGGWCFCRSGRHAACTVLNGLC
jgi:hypothetical protein